MSIRRGTVAVSTGFGKRLAEVLAEQEVSQQALAQRLRSSPSFISALVRGQKAPGSEFLVSLHEALGVGIDWLLTGRGAKYEMGDVVQDILVQVQLARLATTEMNASAAALLARAHPDIDFGAPTERAVCAEDTERLLSDLAARNQDVAIAISIANQRIAAVPPSRRSAAIAAAIAELVAANRRPGIFKALQPTHTNTDARPKTNPEDGINWNPDPLPPGQKVGDQLKLHRDAEADVKPQSRKRSSSS